MVEELLDDYVDGILSEDVGAQVRSHLESCMKCFRSAAQHRALMAAAAALPRELAPSRDLWPEIRAVILRRRISPIDEMKVLPAAPRVPGAPAPGAETLRAAPAAALPQRPWRRLLGLAAAAVLLVATSSALTTVLVQSRYEEVARPLVPGRDAVRGLAAECRLVTVEWSRGKGSAGGYLSPDAVRVIDKNLALIDAAIAEAEDAWQGHPNDPKLTWYVTTAYEEKAQLLHRAARLGVGI
ncbi:MAG: zf-HC2 domain-containing protein [Candidatus Schekmanbacteria bacterium]|nr:zf-HC2 domain-containing protein [Candidatus Schekmanbacteria bacterium]